MDETRKRAAKEVGEIYADLEANAEARNCIGRTTCCRFRLTGKTPMLTAGEALVAAKGVRASGRKELRGSDSDDGSCPLLNSEGACTIYAHRPFGCRTHFCEAAGGPYPRKAVQGLIQRLEAVGEMLGDTDVRPISEAVAHALGQLKRSPKRRRRR